MPSPSSEDFDVARERAEQFVHAIEKASVHQPVTMDYVVQQTAVLDDGIRALVRYRAADALKARGWL